MIRKQFVLAVVIAAMGAVPGVTGAANPAEKALHARGDALNRHYGLGAYARGTETSRSHGLRALDARGDGLNRHYGLGAYARGTETSRSDWLRALDARSNGLNRAYGLGVYARHA